VKVQFRQCWLARILLAIVFMWTPPHFWALATVRMKDYERADVPMMPVIHGQEKTRRHILIYTIELLAVTLLMPIFNLAGNIYY
jgi:heme o synthase